MSVSLTVERLRAVLHYDGESGVFTWLVSRGTQKAGKVAGTRKKLGYVAIFVDGHSYQAHRLAWLYVHGVWPAGEIDHRNGVRHENRISNLRDVSRRINKQNTRVAYANNSTGMLGVKRSRSCNRWEAVIVVNGGSRYLGLFKTPELASAAYLAAKREMHDGCTL